MDNECSDILNELESWYGRESGQYLLHSTSTVLQGLLDTSFGYHIMQLGLTRGQALFEGSPINHRIYACSRAGQSVSLVCDSDELPLESDSVDAVIAHHSLEFTPHPHQVLREIQRVLTPQGQLLVIGFNPYSLAGLGHYLRRRTASALWRHHRPVSERRLTDWLHLLDCEVQATTRLFTVPPIGRGRLRGWLTRADQWSNRYNLPLGGLYVLQAIKQQPALHRRRRHLRLTGDRLMGLAVPKPKTAPSPTPVAPVHRKPGPSGGDVAA